MKATGFVLFWMVEHGMLLEGKVLSAKVSKVRSCKQIEQFWQIDRYNVGF